MRPKEVTDFLRCGGMNCDNSCERYPNQIGDCMTARVHDYVIDLEQRVPRWISVEERLPDHEHEVLVYTDRYGGRTEFAYYVRHLEAWYQNCCLLIPNVTHWMPLPEPPEEGES